MARELAAFIGHGEKETGLIGREGNRNAGRSEGCGAEVCCVLHRVVGLCTFEPGEAEDRGTAVVGRGKQRRRANGRIAVEGVFLVVIEAVAVGIGCAVGLGAGQGRVVDKPVAVRQEGVGVGVGAGPALIVETGAPTPMTQGGFMVRFWVAAGFAGKTAQLPTRQERGLNLRRR